MEKCSSAALAVLSFLILDIFQEVKTFPWSVSIHLWKEDRVEYSCAGTLMSENFALVAAVCVTDEDGNEVASEDIFVQLGNGGLDADNYNIENYLTVSRVLTEPDFEPDDPSDKKYIALLELQTNVTYNDTIQHAYVNFHLDLFDEKGIYVGWSRQNNKQFTKEYEYNKSACYKDGYNSKVFENCITLSNVDNICNLDKGGSVYSNRMGLMALTGVYVLPDIPKGKSCSDFVGVGLARASFFFAWIKNYTNSRSYHSMVNVWKKPNKIDPSRQYKNVLPQECGQSNPRNYKEKIFDYPWLAFLGRLIGHNGLYNFVGAGTVVNKRYILTSRLSAAEYYSFVRLGGHRTKLDCELDGKTECSLPAVDYKIEHVILHGYFGDIGLVRLTKDIDFADNIQPICLPVSPESVEKNLSQQISIDVTTDYGPDLVEFEVNKVNLTKCVNESYFDDDANAQICTGVRQEPWRSNRFSGFLGSYVCFSDQRRFVLYGVHVVRRQIKGLLGFDRSTYANVSYYMQWIMANMEE